ncbi:hypothetical protein NJB93_20730 [Brucella intermedia]|uniref:hypothetical protein n=1 Tax=Brucella intermedia TaxID=94625 RepID=UPI00209AA530|nr:hypothetical protein [Brucella intermedia]MCO7728989.1 hypothetical protein [Brucella intermedia]
MARIKSDTVAVYDTPSNLGGSFTVSIKREIDPETVEVRVWYGRATPNGWEPWRDWDGYTFQTRRDRLTNPRTMRLRKP